MNISYYKISFNRQTQQRILCAVCNYGGGVILIEADIKKIRKFKKFNLNLNDRFNIKKCSFCKQ